MKERIKITNKNDNENFSSGFIHPHKDTAVFWKISIRNSNGFLDCYDMSGKRRMIKKCDCTEIKIEDVPCEIQDIFDKLEQERLNTELK